MKKLMTAGITLVLTALLTLPALAMEVPTSSVVQNLNGVQQYIKTYTVSPETDPASLIEDPFDYEGYTYSYLEMTMQENRFSDEKEQTETVSVDTEFSDKDKILEELAPTLDYDDGDYKGTLFLDHTTIRSEVSGYGSYSSTISATREIDNLDSNDMAYIPATTVEDGVTIPLCSVDWQVQSTVLVGDLLVPSTYKAVAIYSGKIYYSAPNSYVSTADYKGTVSRSGIRDITYTVTYIGKPVSVPVETTPTPEPESELTRAAEGSADSEAQVQTQAAETDAHAFDFWHSVWPYVIGGFMVLALLGTVLIMVVRSKHGQHERRYYPARTEEDDYDEE